MDVLTSTFYALVCGGLAAFAPQGATRIVRGAIGVLVGLAAASLWPLLHGLLLR
jgi:hypothetical protein